MLSLKRTLVSFVAAVVFVMLVFSVTETGLSAMASVLLWPGALVATAAGYGRDDLQGILLYILGNMAFYWILIAFTLWLLKVRRPVPR